MPPREASKSAATASPTSPSVEGLKGPRQGVLAGRALTASRLVQVPDAVLAHLEVPLLDQNADQSADGRVARRVGHVDLDVRRSGFAPGVHDVEDLALSPAEGVSASGFGSARCHGYAFGIKC